MAARITLTRLIHYKWIAQADAAAQREGFRAVIAGRRDHNGYAAVEFSTVVLRRSEVVVESLDRILAMAVPGYWSSSEVEVRTEPHAMLPSPVPLVAWVRDATQGSPVWIGRDQGELVGIITELVTGGFEAYRSGTAPATYSDLAAAQAHLAPTS